MLIKPALLSYGEIAAPRRATLASLDHPSAKIGAAKK
jgi:hypothetical protein